MAITRTNLPEAYLLLTNYISNQNSDFYNLNGNIQCSILLLYNQLQTLFKKFKLRFFMYSRSSTSLPPSSCPTLRIRSDYCISLRKYLVKNSPSPIPSEENIQRFIQEFTRIHVSNAEIFAMDLLDKKKIKVFDVNGFLDRDALTRFLKEMMLLEIRRVTVEYFKDKRVQMNNATQDIPIERPEDREEIKNSPDIEKNACPPVLDGQNDANDESRLTSSLRRG